MPATQRHATSAAPASSAPSSTLRDPFRSPRLAVTARAKAGPPPPPPAPPALTATSLIISGNKGIATLRGPNRFLVVGVGDWVDGWRVVGVTEDGVSLRYGASGDAAAARLVADRFTRSKGGKTNEAGPQVTGYVSGSGAALPGGDIPLLPETAAPRMGGLALGQRADLPRPERSRSNAMQPMVPRLVPTP
ncbi:MAG: hypothetical protein ACR2M1_17355 [Gemmatimonadaceae bacterium]